MRSFTISGIADCLLLGDTRLQIHQNPLALRPRTIAGIRVYMARVTGIHQRTTPSLSEFCRAFERQIEACTTRDNDAGKPEWGKWYRSKATNSFWHRLRLDIGRCNEHRCGQTSRRALVLFGGPVSNISPPVLSPLVVLAHAW